MELRWAPVSVHLFFILIRFIGTSKVIYKLLSKFDELDLFVISDDKCHLIGANARRSIEPLDARDVGRDLVGAHIVKLILESGEFCHVLQAWKLGHHLNIVGSRPSVTIVDVVAAVVFLRCVHHLDVAEVVTPLSGSLSALRTILE